MQIIFFAALLRVLFSFFPSFTVDMNAWLAWAHRLNELGFAEFYSNTVWTQYTPGYLYWLWLIGKLGLVNQWLIKLPVIFADIGTAFIIIKIINKKANKLLITFLYILSPPIIFVGSIWGQIDGILTLFLLTSFYFLVEKKNLSLSWIFWSLAFLIKPQSIAFLPLLTFISFKKYPISKIIKSAIFSITSLIIFSLPFFPNNPIFGLPNLIIKMGDHYSFTSLYAHNLWSLVTGFWVNDASYKILSLVLFSSAILFSIYSVRKLRTKSDYYLGAALSAFSFFLFPTRVHERYLFPFFAFFLVFSFLKKQKRYLHFYVLLSFLFLLNLYHPYAYYENNILTSQSLLNLINTISPLIALSFLTIFFYLLKTKQSLKIKNKTLFAILVFALITRLISLHNPQKEYFDEVYHAFTAQKMLQGDLNVWHWRGTPPEGFAYEWTHPHLAKEFMAVSMAIFGQKSFGWRLPSAILGTISVYLIYLISKNLFKNNNIALLSSAIFVLDGLPLVMSRIGMNDTYFLFFMLLSFYFFLRDKHFSSALSLGLSLASKWSAIWFIPILILTHFSQKKPFKKSLLLFAIIPPIIYILTYLPLFLNNFGWEGFIELQKQMWWYHTRLDATHPFASPWYSWPFLYKPIWIYQGPVVNNTLTKIYAMGNPIIFWFGLFSIITSFYYSYKSKNKNLALIIFSYIAFFVPWAASPRIMFLYHYLPSVPFMAIATGFVLHKNKKLIAPFLVISLIIFLYFFPRFIGLPIPTWLDKSYHWLPSW